MINKKTLEKYITEWEGKNNKLTLVAIEYGKKYLNDDISQKEFFDKIVGHSCPMLKGFNQICNHDSYSKMCHDCWIKFLS